MAEPNVAQTEIDFAAEVRDEGRGGRLKHRKAHWLAWSLGIICGALLAASLLLFVLNRSHPIADVWGPWIQETVAVVTFPAIGLLILSRPPQHPIGWLFCGSGLAGGLDHFFGEYAIYALQARPDSVPGGEVAAWLVSWMWVPFNALLVYVALLYPNGRPPSKRWRPVAWLVGIAVVVTVSVEALLPIAVCNVCSIENPLGIESLGSVGELVDALIEAFWYGVLGFVAVASLYVRFRHAGEVERRQIKWVAYAASVVVLGTTLAYGVYDVTGVRWSWHVGMALFAIGLVGTPIAVGIAISRHRHLEVPPLRDRPHHRPYTRLWLAHGGDGRHLRDHPRFGAARVACPDARGRLAARLLRNGHGDGGRLRAAQAPNRRLRGALFAREGRSGRGT